MSIIDTTSKPLPVGFTEVINIGIQNLRVCLDCKTTADIVRLRDALEAANLAITVVSRDLNILTNSPNLQEVTK
jgi:hypothetical protein